MVVKSRLRCVSKRMVKRESNPNETPVKHWQVRVIQQWSSTGQTPVKHGSNSGRARVKHQPRRNGSRTGQSLHWSSTGRFRENRPGGVVQRSLVHEMHSYGQKWSRSGQTVVKGPTWMLKVRIISSVTSHGAPITTSSTYLLHTHTHTVSYSQLHTHTHT